MEALILLATPIVVTLFTEQLKRVQRVKLSTQKSAILRLFALTLSVGGVIVGAVATGHDVPVTEITAYVEAVLLFAATQIPYLLGKKSGESV